MTTAISGSDKLFDKGEVLLDDGNEYSHFEIIFNY